MTTNVTVKTIYNCSLERAFKTPMLCDIAKVHTGLLIMPKVTHCTNDEHWGKPGFSKTVFMGKSPAFKGGEASTDTVIERIENQYWKIEVGNFKMNMLGFTKFVGEWATNELAPNKIEITYRYTMHSDNVVLYPINWLFTKLFWRRYMHQVLNNIRVMAEGNEPYQYE